jgi:hypothetical protein
VAVPKELVAAEPGLRKKTKMLKGTAGPRLARLITERGTDNAKKESNLQYMEMEKSGSATKEPQQAKSLPFPT